MENKLLYDRLLDFYGILLTDRQREICRYYYREDLSLQEISEIVGTSRSAVYDNVNRCRHELDSYEEKLHLYASWKKRMSLYEKIRERGDRETGRLIDACIDTENS